MWIAGSDNFTPPEVFLVQPEVEELHVQQHRDGMFGRGAKHSSPGGHLAFQGGPREISSNGMFN